jgi:threonine dehydratase
MITRMGSFPHPQDPAPPAPDLDLPTEAEIEAARARIAPHVHRTPMVTSSTLDALAGAELFFKLETLQKVGAFKARGATNAVFALPEDVPAVATHSSGNHALGLAYAASRRGLPCTVVMPTTAARPKRAAVEGYGVRIVDCAPSTRARETALADVVAETGAAVVHPYDDRQVIAGQATCGLEMLEDTGGLDAIIVPIGGGGLLSGTCLACAAVAPLTAVYAAEPEAADDAFRSFRSGTLTAHDAPATIADGLRAPPRGRTWEVLRSHAADVLLVSEAEIVAAMRLIWERLKLVAEPSAAVPLAAILRHRATFEGKRVGVVLTGGNVDLDRLPWLGG